MGMKTGAAYRFALSTLPLYEEGEFAKPPSGLPRAPERHADKAEIYTISYTYIQSN
jgi:hypothetical protein